MEYEVQNMMNVSSQDVHLHLQIIALKCFLYLFCVENFLVNRLQELKFLALLVPFFFILSNYLISRIVSFFAFGLGLVLMHNELNSTMLYVYFLTCCVVFPSFQVILDAFLISWYVTRIVATNNLSNSVLYISISIIAWNRFPPKLLFYFMLSFCIMFIFIRRGMERLKGAYVATVFNLLACFYVYPLLGN